MKYLYLLLFFAFTVINGQIINTELAGHIDPIPSNAPKHYADIWGYAAPDGSEYALIDGYSGVYIINITDPANPQVVTMIDGPQSIWRDIKVYQNYAYFVAEDGMEGVQIVDLSALPDSAKLVGNYNATFYSAHNIFIDGGYAFVVGADQGGGMHILDLSDPIHPVETAYYSQSGYIHDVYVWNDTVVACAANSYDLVDVTDKSNPYKISESGDIPGIYAHSGWMTEDKRYFLAAEEFNVRDMIVFDLIDKTNWQVVVPSYQLANDTRIHNIFVKGDYAYCSYYEAGLVILDVSDPAHPLFAGQYDTYPTDNGSFNGVWGAYPFLPSGNIIISDQEKGLYIIKFNGGDTPPGISFSLNSDFISDTGPQIITAQIFDNSSVVDAKLFFRTSKNGNISDWTIVEDANGPDPNFNYKFEIPGQSSGTKVDFYFAAADDSGNVVTLPSGGSGTNPIGSIPPENFYSYTVITSIPQITSVTPDIVDTTITRGETIPFSVEAIDTSGLEVRVRWFVNGRFKIQRSSYLFTSAFGTPLPRVDTVKAVVTNGFYSTERIWFVHVEALTDVKDELTPYSFKLYQNYPNPFNPSTSISFNLPKSSYVSLNIYNVIGEKIAVLVDREMSKGTHSITFDASGLSSGIYFYKLSAGEYSDIKKMILAK